MKAHKIEIIIIDHEDCRADDYWNSIFNHLDGGVILHDSKTIELGEWRDDHPLNLASTTKEETEAYFK